MLHFETPNTPLEFAPDNSLQGATNHETSVFGGCSIAASRKRHSILLATAQISVQDQFGNFQTFRAIIDTASQAHFMTLECAHRLGLVVKKATTSIQGLGQSSSSATTSGTVQCCISPVDSRDIVFKIEALVIRSICSNLPSVEIDTSPNWEHLKNLTLADVNALKPVKIDILLGAELYPSIIRNGCISGQPGQPSALNTVFGWVLIGKVETCETSAVDTTKAFFTSIEHQSIERTIKKF